MNNSKRFLTLFLCCAVILVLLPITSYAEVSIPNNEVSTMDIEVLAGGKVSRSEIRKIQSEMRALEKCNLDELLVVKINLGDESNEYVLNFGDVIDVLTFNEISNEQISFTVTEGDIVNTFTKTSDGKVFIDGNEVYYSEGEIQELGKPVWESTKSEFPLGGHSEGDYTRYLSSGKSNAAMEEAWANVTIACVAAAIGVWVPFVGIATTIAMGVRDMLRSVNPNANTISCKYDTYIADADDYQYRTKVYATSNQTGTYYRVNTYEHFIVY